MKRAALVPVLLLSLLFAGCLNEEAAPGEPLAALPPAVDPGAVAPLAGTVLVLVTTPTLDPVADAHVRLGAWNGTSDAAGEAWFRDVAVGRYNITVEKDGWRGARSGIDVVANQSVTATVKLLPGDEPVPDADNEVYQRHYEFAGVFECAATYLIITGDCLLIADYAAQEAGLPVQPGDMTEDHHIFEFPLDAGWQSVHVEMHWDPMTVLGDEMQIALEPTEAPADGHAAKYARVFGTGPLSFTLQKGVPHETASLSADGESSDLPNAEGGEVVRTRSYVLGEMHNPGGTEFLGVGAAYGQRFDVYVTVFYGAPAPDGYVWSGGDA